MLPAPDRYFGLTNIISQYWPAADVWLLVFMFSDMHRYLNCFLRPEKMLKLEIVNGVITQSVQQRTVCYLITSKFSELMFGIKFKM